MKVQWEFVGNVKLKLRVAFYTTQIAFGTAA